MLVFLIGTGRSGSTMLVELLSRHRSVGFISNIDDRLSGLNLKGRWNNLLHHYSQERAPELPAFEHRRQLWESARLRVGPSEGYNLLDRQVSPIISMPCRDLVAADVTPWLAGELRSFFEERIIAQRRSTFTHHFTGWPRARFLHAVFPDARFIHVVRDGRAVANSWLQMGWWQGYRGPAHWGWGPLPESLAQEWERSGRSFVLLAGLLWKLLIESFRTAREEIPADQWLEVRYEDVLEAPSQGIASILEFMGLELTHDFQATIARYRFRKGRVDAFRRELDPANLALLQRSLTGLLDAYGYPTRHVADLQFGQERQPVQAGGTGEAAVPVTAREPAEVQGSPVGTHGYTSRRHVETLEPLRTFLSRRSFSDSRGLSSAAVWTVWFICFGAVLDAATDGHHRVGVDAALVLTALLAATISARLMRPHRLVRGANAVVGSVVFAQCIDVAIVAALIVVLTETLEGILTADPSRAATAVLSIALMLAYLGVLGWLARGTAGERLFRTRYF